MLLPSWLTWPLTSAKAVEDAGAEVTGQMALAHFISAGELDRHLRRMRLTYARRRRKLLELLAERLPAVRPSDDPAGVFELLRLPSKMDEAGFLAAAARRGVGLEGLSWHRSGDALARGVLVGYAAVSEPALERAVGLMEEAMAETGS
jgi:GntR family transcriptional regulator/MocR family aminotransferase